MVYHMDNYDAGQKKAYVISATTTGLVFSTVTYGMRLQSRRLITKRLYHEDWWMLAGLLCSYGIAAMTFWGFDFGLGEHEATILARPDANEIIKGALLSVWIIQRLYPPAHLLIKTSIIIFYVRIFRTRCFRRVAWAVWVYTFLWSIQAQVASLLECQPPAYFYDRNIEGGSCVPDPLINISLTESVLNTLGDLAIFIMPMPMLKHLHVNERKRAALYAIFAVGLFVNIISVIRWVSLLGTAEDITSSLPTASVWTYLEVSMAITCGNLPLLAPLFGSIFKRRNGSSNKRYKYNQHPSSRSQPKVARNPSIPGQQSGIIYPEEFALNNRSEEALAQTYVHTRPRSSDSQQILVRDEVIVSYEEPQRSPSPQQVPDPGSSRPHISTPAPTYSSRAWA
ncbi:hypothetical protein JX265_005987 [Neoarthrinium moseri]|uniref:Rhodopsin domain-containing protein n=1 Tax=Neoarthrinium moseri TaxID=1658444 RepID=A0A9P9WMQ5_9PEZI|nr:hypothetical protein JX265_005987 [Neoarthrinium moseri]